MDNKTLESTLKNSSNPHHLEPFYSQKFRKNHFKRVFFALLIATFFSVAHSKILYAKTTILMLGDSLTAGYGIEKEFAFPSLVEKQLLEKGFTDIRVINGGFSGSTSASAVKRMQWYMRVNPDVLVLGLGANDGLRGHKIESIKNNLSKTIEIAQSRNMKVLLAGMKMPRNYGKPYTQAYENLFGEVAEKYSIPLIPFLLEGVAGDPSLNLADGIHPNPKGHEIIASTVMKYLVPLLEE